MSQLEASWVLEERLQNAPCSAELKAEILRYIEMVHPKCTGRRLSFSNLYYRSNLHYIEDHLTDDKLLGDLRALNDKYPIN